MKRFLISFTLLIAFTTSEAVAAAAASGLAAHPEVLYGTVHFSKPAPNHLVATQEGDKAIIQWNGFSLEPDMIIEFIVPDPKFITLNKVAGSESALLRGRLTSNGITWVVSPGGLSIGNGANIDASLFCTTNEISNGSFIDGSYVFTGRDPASIILGGSIKVQHHKGLYLAGKHIRALPDMALAAPFCTVLWAATEGLTLRLDESGIKYKIHPAASDGMTLELAKGSKINAPNSRIEMVTQDVTFGASLIQVDGAVQTTRSPRYADAGSIQIKGGKGSTVKVGGQLSAIGSGIQGGSICATGTEAYLAGAVLDVSRKYGKYGGGIILIGRDRAPFSPLGDELKADVTNIAADVTLKADGIHEGNGGKIYVWGTRFAGFEGFVSARGGDEGGDGGFFQLDGAMTVRSTGARFDFRAPKGRIGSYDLNVPDALSGLAQVLKLIDAASKASSAEVSGGSEGGSGGGGGCPTSMTTPSSSSAAAPVSSAAAPTAAATSDTKASEDGKPA